VQSQGLLFAMALPYSRSFEIMHLDELSDLIKMIRLQGSTSEGTIMRLSSELAAAADLIANNGGEPVVGPNNVLYIPRSDWLHHTELQNAQYMLDLVTWHGNRRAAEQFPYDMGPEFIQLRQQYMHNRLAMQQGANILFPDPLAPNVPDNREVIIQPSLH
jgi:hypothetical protein